MHLLLIQSKPALLGNGLAERPQDQRSVYAIPRQTDESRDHPVAFKQRSNSVQMPFKCRSNSVQTASKCRSNSVQMAFKWSPWLQTSPPEIPPSDPGVWEGNLPPSLSPETEAYPSHEGALPAPARTWMFRKIPLHGVK